MRTNSKSRNQDGTRQAERQARLADLHEQITDGVSGVHGGGGWAGADGDTPSGLGAGMKTAIA